MCKRQLSWRALWPKGLRPALTWLRGPPSCGGRGVVQGAVSNFGWKPPPPRGPLTRLCLHQEGGREACGPWGSEHRQVCPSGLTLLFLFGHKRAQWGPGGQQRAGHCRLRAAAPAVPGLPSDHQPPSPQGPGVRMKLVKALSPFLRLGTPQVPCDLLVVSRWRSHWTSGAARGLRCLGLGESSALSAVGHPWVYVCSLRNMPSAPGRGTQRPPLSPSRP